MRLTNKKQQVEKYLRRELLRGRWPVGEQMPSEDCLLDEIGVSRSTIREALNSLSAEGIVIRKHGTGTFVERIPLRSIVISAWFENLTTPMGYWYRELVNNARALIMDEGYQFDVVVGNGADTEAAVTSACRFINGPVSKDFMGAINLMPTGNIDRQFEKMNIPVVNIQVGVPQGRYAVVLDYVGMVNKAIQLIHGYGVEDFAVMYVDDPIVKFGEPLYKYLNDLLQVFSGDNARLLPIAKYEDAYGAFKEWYSSEHQKAIFFMDDAIYEFASKAIMELNIDVPGDLRVVTHANVGRKFQIPIPVDKIGFDASEAVDIAWKMIKILIEDEPVDENIRYLQPKIHH